MRYKGGKHAVAGRIADLILEMGEGCHTYLDPFVGGASVPAKVAPHFSKMRLGDLHPDVIPLWEAVLHQGWEPPDEISKAEFQALKATVKDPDVEPSALRGFAGFGCSFGADYFAGYAKNTAGSAGRGLMKKAAQIGQCPDVMCRAWDYRRWRPRKGWVVYADPPYTHYSQYAVPAFNPFEFWETMVRWTLDGAVVVVTEDMTPAWVTHLATWERRSLMSGQGNNQGTYNESAYTIEPETAARVADLFRAA